ncbi:unnamed protein product, partial [Mesorhabditis belari]|uniref:Uncharacterized protein n=1 Tax=Mesorhabditis belari TaxID=2138241 RepID=A0AAF3FGS3_9BILA
MFSRTSIYYFLSILLPVIVSIRRQSVGVKGKLLCGNQPLQSATIVLSDEDSGPEFDDKMAEGTTNAHGHFQIHGTEVEFTSIEPRLTILHKCNYKWICKREVTFHIPRKYINHGKSVKKWFDLGTLNMETVFPGEEHNCFRIFW